MFTATDDNGLAVNVLSTEIKNKYNAQVKAALIPISTPGPSGLDIPGK